MTTKPHELTRSLDKGLKPVYLVSGDEPLLVQECCDDIRSAARAAGYQDRQVYHADQQLDWRVVGEELNALSLFAEKRRIEVHLGNGRLGNDGQAVIEQTLTHPPDDVVVLLIGTRLERSETRKKWYKALQSHGVHVPIWPLDPERFPDWLRQRANSRGLHLTRGALETLTERLEGNLLAASQEVDRLALLAPDETLDDTFIEQAVMDSARFSVFELVAALMRGQVRQAHRIIGVLQQEGENPLPLLGLLGRDIRMTLQLQQARRQGESPSAFCQRQRVFPKQRAQQLQEAASRLSPARLRAALTQCSDIDRAAKGYDKLSAWYHLQELATALR